MKVSWDKIRIGDVVECEHLKGNATAYHADHRGVFVCSKAAAEARIGHCGTACGHESQIKGPRGYWNFWEDAWPELTIVKQAKRFKGNS